MAKQHVANQQAAIAQGVYVDDSRGKVSFAEWWADHYFATAGRRLARTTLARDEMLLRVYVLSRWGSVPLGKITKSSVERWVAELGDPSRVSVAAT
ncbi:MAG: hypothetical protein AB1679_00945 [Actinomycetota bacterium]